MEYSNLFTDGVLQIQLQKDSKDEIEIKIVNATGGETWEDQSSGERRLLALMIAFALRQVSGQSSLLVLDEPGDGLDACNQKLFAAGICKLRESFDSVFLITHDDTLATEFSGERVLRVSKIEGVSHCSFM